MAVNPKTGKVVRSKSLTQKTKAAVTRRHNKTSGKTKTKRK